MSTLSWVGCVKPSFPRLDLSVCILSRASCEVSSNLLRNFGLRSRSDTTPPRPLGSHGRFSRRRSRSRDLQARSPSLLPGSAGASRSPSGAKGTAGCLPILQKPRGPMPRRGGTPAEARRTEACKDGTARGREACRPARHRGSPPSSLGSAPCSPERLQGGDITTLEGILPGGGLSPTRLEGEPAP